MERVTATYLIETALPIAKAAATLAGEQSSGTFVAVPGETAELKERFAARVERMHALGNQLGCQWYVGGDHQIAGLTALHDLVIGHIKTTRHLYRPDKT